MTPLRRLADWGPLAWLAVAWLAGPVPPVERGVTGQPLDGLWWWHVAAVLVAVHWVVRGRTRPDARPLTEVVWAPGRRWLTVAVLGWASLAVIAAAQASAGASTWGPALTAAAAAVAVTTGAWRSVGGEAVGRLAAVGVLLAVGATVAFVLAADRLGGPAGFYAVKERMVLPGASHNVLASLLLVGGAAVAVQVGRSPRWRWALPVVGLGLGATLSRGALVAGGVGVLAAVVLRDRRLARRVAVVVGTATVVVVVVLLRFGAELPAGSDDTSVASRVALWDAAIEVAAADPLVGAGADGLLDTAPMQALSFPHEHAHNLLLHVWATTGVLGLAATGAVWGGVAAGALASFDRDRRNLVLVGLAALGAHAMVDEVAARPVTVGLLVLLTLTLAAPLEPATPARAPAFRPR